MCFLLCRRLFELLYEATADKQQLDAVVAVLPGKHGNLVKLATSDARELACAFPVNQVRRSSTVAAVQDSHSARYWMHEQSQKTSVFVCDLSCSPAVAQMWYGPTFE